MNFRTTELDDFLNYFSNLFNKKVIYFPEDFSYIFSSLLQLSK